MGRKRILFGTAALLTGSALGADPVPIDLVPVTFPQRRTVIVPDCPTPPRPAYPPIVPPDSKSPNTPDPKSPDTPPTTTPPPVDTLARAPETGAQPSASLNPSMFGDFFGAVGNNRILLVPNRLQATVTGSASFAPSIGRGGAPDITVVFSPSASGARINLTSDQVNGVTSVSPSRIPGFTSNLTQRVPGGGGIAVFQVNANTTNIGPLVVDKLNNTADGRRAMVIGLNALKAYQAFGKDSAFFTSVSNVTLEPTGVYDPNTSELIYGYSLTATGLKQVGFDQGIPITNPTSGGVVGRTKISEDNSPIPRDRVFFNYDYYGGAALTNGGLNVHRISAGFETTFLDGQGSFEVRVPLASTLDSAITLDGITGRNAELGNVAIGGKWLWNPGAEIQIASGITGALPTGQDSVVRLLDGTELVRIKNESVLLTSYIAALWSPTDRTFAQAWLSVSGDPFGNRLQYNNLTTGNIDTQRIYDLPIVSADIQLGYWLARATDPTETVQGFAPFVELHWNGSFDLGNAQAKFDDVVVAEARTGYSDVNLTLGSTLLMRGGLAVSQGLVFPLRERPDRAFDWQYGLRLNWLFGAQPTVADRFSPGTGGMVAGSGLGGDAGASDGMGGAGEGAMADVLARAPETGAQPAASLNPNFFGDFVGLSARAPQGLGVNQLPLTSRYQGFKIADLDGPRPSDRVWFGMNRYSQVGAAGNAPGQPEMRLTRQVIGVETILAPGISVGARLPFLQLSGSPQIEGRKMGDLVLAGKYVIEMEPDTGDVLTAGMNITLPTGGNIAPLADGGPAPKAILFHPWLGSAQSHGKLFSQWVVAMLLPTDPVYPTAMFGSIGGGYWLYRNENDSLIRGIAPVVELHANVPLTNRSGTSLVSFADQFNVTAGLHMIFPTLTVSGAVATPISGPRPFDIEALLTVTYQF